MSADTDDPAPPPGETCVDQTLPPFVVRALESGLTLEPIRLDKNGRWWHRGNLLDHPRIARLFSRSIGRTEGGTWVLEIGRFTYPIEIDDAPLHVLAVSLEERMLTARLSDQTKVHIDPAALRLVDDGVVVHNCKNGFDARLTREACVQLSNWITEDPDGRLSLVLPTGKTRLPTA